MKNGAKGLGRSQRLVLILLGDKAKSCRTLAYDHPALTESAARSAIDRLGMRGLVDAVRFEGNERLFGLTESGRSVLASFIGDDEGEP